MSRPEYTTGQLRSEMARMGVPVHLHDGFIRYLADGVPTGAGIRRILEDRPVSEVVAGLDDECLARLREITKFVYNFAPSASWGSQATVAAWITAKTAGRHEAGQ